MHAAGTGWRLVSDGRSYADLRQHRKSNYVFEFDKMLEPKGDTAVYALYAYARLCRVRQRQSPAATGPHRPPAPRPRFSAHTSAPWTGRR